MSQQLDTSLNEMAYRREIYLDAVTDKITFIILAGGNATRMDGFPKSIYPVNGNKTPLGSTIDDLFELLKRPDSVENKDKYQKPEIAVSLRPPHDSSIDAWIKERYNGSIDRIIFEKGATKAYAVYNIAKQKIKTDYVAILHGDVFYNKNLLLDALKQLYHLMQDDYNADAGFVYLTKISPPTEGALIQLTDVETRRTNGYQRIIPKLISYIKSIDPKKRRDSKRLHPVITVFNVKKLLELTDIPKKPIKKERAGLTYLYQKLMKKGYHIRAIVSPYTISDINTPEAWLEKAESTKKNGIQEILTV